MAHFNNGLTVAGDISLNAIAASIHSGVIVKAIIYDSSRDSDGGAWRKRCADKSWYTETLGGTAWMGGAATTAAAWALPGADVGCVFQNTTDKKFYSLTGTSTASEVFRGISREFPEQVAIVVEAARVVIYDVTAPGCPMWMSFVGGASNWINTSMLWNFSLSSVCALNAKIVCCHANAGGPAVITLDFISDSAISKTSNVSYGGRYSGNLALRNSTTGYYLNGVGSTGYSIIPNAMVNDVAITVLDGAPIDPATGLPVPTIFVGTAGGLSTITNLGTVTNSTSTVSVTKCVANGSKLTTVRSDGVVSTWADTTTIAVAPDTTYTASSTPAVLGTVTVAA